MPWKRTGQWRYSSTFLDLGTIWRWVVSFTPLPLYLRGKGLQYPLDRRLGGAQILSRRCGEEKNLALPGIEPRPCSPSLEYAIPRVRRSEMGRATGCELEDRGSIPGRFFFYLFCSVQTGSGAHPASYPIGSKGCFPGVKQPERDVGFSPPLCFAFTGNQPAKSWIFPFLIESLRGVGDCNRDTSRREATAQVLWRFESQL
jgi:hypothetical protein